jgi:hypothetical protein
MSRKRRWEVGGGLLLGATLVLSLIAYAWRSREREELLIKLHQEHPVVIRDLVRHGLSVHTRRGDGATLLMVAAKIGEPELIREMLQRGGEVRDRDTIDCTAVMYATHPEAIRTLVAAGADVNAANEFGFTALISAAQQGELEAVRTLLALGADPTAKTTDGLTALDWATQVVQEGGVESRQIPQFRELIRLLQPSGVKGAPQSGRRRSPDATQAGNGSRGDR